MRTRHFLALLFVCSYCFGPARAAHSQQTSTDGGRRILSRTAPVYPEVAKRFNLGGTVKVVAVVGPDGGVKYVEPKGGSPLLLKAAEDAVSKWKFASGGSESREMIEVHFAP